MKQFLTVLKFELNNYFKNKSFVITTLLLVLLIVGVIVVPTLIPGLLGSKDSEGNKETAEELETLGVFVDTEEVEDVERLLSYLPAQWKTYEKETELKQAVEKEEIEAGFILNGAGEATYVVNNLSVSDYLSEAFEQAMARYQKEQYLASFGMSPEEIQKAEASSVILDTEILGKNSVRNYGYTYALVFIVYFLILFYGQMIAVSVTTEKSNRAIEILVTSVNPNSLIFGKVLAGAIAGILQTVLILGTGFVTYGAFSQAWGGMLDFLFDVPSKVLLAYVVFGTLSYLLYAFIFGTLGAMVSKTEDISKSSTLVTLIYVASFLIAMVGLSNSDTLLMKVASFVPFTSGNAMFIRISMGNVAFWEIALSLALLLGSCWITGVLAAKLFRFGTLHYGNPLKLSKALKGIRNS